MTTLREAAQQALDALERAGEDLRWQSIGQAMHDLRAALAKPERRYSCPICAGAMLEDEFDPTTQSAGSPQTTSNPVAIFDEALGHPVLLSHAPMLADEQPLYTHPPREWQGLTDEELDAIYAEPQTHAGQYARAIERALKERNT